MREIPGSLKTIQKELIADGNRRKPPISNTQHQQQQSSMSTCIAPESSSKSNNMTTNIRPLSTVSSEGLSAIDDVDDIDDDITTTASESYVQDDSSTNEGKINFKCLKLHKI